MSPVIRVPENLYSRLEQHAKGFDTPANVIETLLNHFEGVNQNVLNITLGKEVTKKRDTTKYAFNNLQYGKGKLVLAVIKYYVASHPETTYDNLVKIFPKHLQGSIGVFNELRAVQEKYENKDHKRHFIQDAIGLKDCDIVVSTEWGVSNINDFIEQAVLIGCSITPTDGAIVTRMIKPSLNSKYNDMTKNKAIEMVNNHFQEYSLNDGNTNIASINTAKDVWWFNIPPQRLCNDLHLLLKKKNGFIWLKISANTFTSPQDIFKLRSDVDKIDLEISSDRKNNYMIDIKSGGTNYNFNPHIKYEFNQDT